MLDPIDGFSHGQICGFEDCRNDIDEMQERIASKSSSVTEEVKEGWRKTLDDLKEQRENVSAMDSQAALKWENLGRPEEALRLAGLS